MKPNYSIFIFVLTLICLGSCQNCKKTVIVIGNPTLQWSIPEIDSTSHTFKFTLMSDSTEGAEVFFELIDCDSVIMEGKGTTVSFTGINPLDEGYDVTMRVKWPDNLMKMILYQLSQCPKKFWSNLSIIKIQL